MAKKRAADTARLRKINDAAKECAEVVAHNSAGRPPKYHPHFCLMIDVLADGLISSTNYQLAAMFGVRESGTIERWEQEHPAFREAVKRGRAKVDQLVEDALFKRAIGYQHPEQKVFCAPRTGEIVTHEVTMQYPPDTKALQFWLGNRHPDKYKQRQEENVQAPVDAAADLRASLAEIEKSTQGGSK